MPAFRFIFVLRLLAVAALTAGFCSMGFAQPQTEFHRISSAGTYVREQTDIAWNLRIVGKFVASQPAFILIHDKDGKLIYGASIPLKEYRKDAPLIIPVRPDGITGDYRILLLGKMSLSLHRPITDLPLEVYGGRDFSLGQDKSLVCFRPPTGVTQMAIGAYKSDLKVLNADDTVLADTKISGKYITDDSVPNRKFFSNHENIVEFPVEAGKTYKLYTAETMYFKTREVVYFAFDPVRLFEPTKEIDAVKWWELVG